MDFNHHGTLKETVGSTFVFPTSTVLKPRQIVRVYTNEDHPEWGVGTVLGVGRRFGITRVARAC